MTSDQDESTPSETQGGTPQPFVTRQVTVRTRPITHIDTFEVLEHELDDLAAVYAQTNQDLNFAIALTGVLLAFIMPLLTSWNSLDTRLIALFAAIAATSGALGLWFFIRWLRLRKRGPELLAKIKSRRPEVTLTEIRQEKAVEHSVQPPAEK